VISRHDAWTRNPRDLATTMKCHEGISPIQQESSAQGPADASDNQFRPDSDSAGYPINRLRATACHERPQQRLENLGAGALSDTELLANVLRSGTRGCDVLTLASQLVTEAGSLAELACWHEADFCRLRGIGRVRASQLVAIMEIGRRAVTNTKQEKPLLNQPEAIAAYMQPYVSGLQVEKFWVLCLDRKNRLIKRVEVTSGTATATLAHPREVFRAAIRESACAVVCAHNHPNSGDPSPSSADVEITRLLRDAAKTVEITLQDHLVLGRISADPLGKGWYSFRQAGLI
jgi:DNA repair protein RadC